jgi:hypothetical protein
MSHPAVRKGNTFLSDPIIINSTELIPVHELSDFIAVRNQGEFADRAIYLSSIYEWVFGYDNEGSLIAIPTRRK